MVRSAALHLNFVQQVGLHIIEEIALSAGVIMLPPDPRQDQHAPSKLTAAEAGRQPRGNMLPPIMSEFQSISSFPCPHAPLPKPNNRNASLARELLLPFPSKHLPYKQVDNQAREQHIQLGVWRSPEEFAQDAMAVERPFGSNGFR